MGAHISPRTRTGGDGSSGANIFRRQQQRAALPLGKAPLLFPRSMPPPLLLLLLLLTILTFISAPVSASQSSFVPVSPSGCSKATKVGGKTITHKLCVALDAGVTLAWTLSGADNTTLNATFVGYPADAYGWVSFGFSPDCQMVGSTAFIAYGNAEDAAMFAVRPFYLQSTRDDGSAVAAAPATFVVNGSPVVEFANGGKNATVHFSVQLDNPGAQCIVFGNGPAFGTLDFNAKPVPFFYAHAEDGAKWSRLDFTTGTDGASPPPPPSVPLPATTSATTTTAPSPPPKASSPTSRANMFIAAAALLGLTLFNFQLVATVAC